MSLDALKAAVCQANLDLVRHGLVTLTWGNVSAVDRHAGLMVIKPSGVDYAQLLPEAMAVVELASGQHVEGRFKPSSDTPTHAHLYREFASLGAIVHTHSPHATSWAQAHRPLPCLGTTHADHFFGTIPLARPMSAEEVDGPYELNTGGVITETFAKSQLNPARMPAVLVAGHGPFVWGPNVVKAVENAIALESVARMALNTLLLSPGQAPIPDDLLHRHFFRKHGASAYYGQG